MVTLELTEKQAALVALSVGVYGLIVESRSKEEVLSTFQVLVASRDNVRNETTAKERSELNRYLIETIPHYEDGGYQFGNVPLPGKGTPKASPEDVATGGYL